MGGAMATSVVGNFYMKHPWEEPLGSVFVRKYLDNYHICVQDPETSNRKQTERLYLIVADVRDPKLAEQIKSLLLKDCTPNID